MRLPFFTLLISFFAFAVQAAQSPCSPDKVSLRGDWGQVAFTVEVADTFEKRAQGLMFRESMPRFSGMIFVFDQPQRAQFWMKNTLIPLDMIFIDEDGKVSQIGEMAVPGSLDTVDGGEGILMVLEINGGMSAALGITAGSEVQYPGFSDTAVWACD
jgi:uncharacterized protein